MVISYTGTNDNLDRLNWFIGFGAPLPQIFDAVDFYFACKAAHPEATNITFTGHSLGGGLASLMAVYFDKQATVFDEAPFQLAALNPLVTDAVGAYMISKGYLDSAFSDYLLSASLVALVRESNVTNYYVEGEALNYPRFSFDTLVGSEFVFSMGNSTASAVERHSMALMTAMQYSNAFRDDVKKLPGLVTALLDDNLFATDARDETKNDLLRNLLRHQLGVSGAIPPDAMLDRFGADFAKLANLNPGSSDADRVKILIDIGLQHYYQQNTTQNAFFNSLSGGVQFDLTAPLGDTATALGSILGYNNLLNYARGIAGTENAIQALNNFSTEKRRWDVAVGAAGLNDTAAGNNSDIVLGGSQNDTFDGGDGDDLLIGAGGYDNLSGGAGADQLFGGIGNDTLIGGTGPDHLYGGLGNDILHGLGGFMGDDLLAMGDAANDAAFNKQERRVA